MRPRSRLVLLSLPASLTSPTPTPAPRSPLGRIGRISRIGLQMIGILGTSHLLDFLAGLAPGHAQSRLAEGPPIGAPLPLPALLLRDAIGVALLEELLFRGLLFELLRRLGGLRPALFGSALLFGAAHLDLHQGPVALILGLQLGALRALFGLWAAIFAHAANNAAALIGSVAGFEPSPASLALAALLSALAWAGLAPVLARPREGHPVRASDPVGAIDQSDETAR